jgi:DNA-binding XRE family transcriptional regulator
MPEERAGFSRAPAETDRQTLGDRLRTAREYVGLKQEEVARHLSIPRSALSNIEAGQRKVDALELTRMAKLYQLPCIVVHRRRRDRLGGVPCRGCTRRAGCCESFLSGPSGTRPIRRFLEVAGPHQGLRRWSIAEQRS